MASNSPFLPSAAGTQRKLRQLRQERGLSQQRLAFLANVTQGSVSAAERGLGTWRVLQALAEVLGVENPADLMRVVGEA